MNRTLAYILIILGLLAVLALVIGLVFAWNAFQAIPLAQVKALVIVAILVALLLLGFFSKRTYLAWLDVQHAKEELLARQDARRRVNERHEVDLYLAKTRLPANEQGNRDYIYDQHTGQVIEVASGNVIQPVPHSYAPHITYSYRDTRPGVIEEPAQQPMLLTPGDLHIPTFAESLAAGDIGPGQRDMLFCYELVEDELTREVKIVPIRGAIGEQHTQLVLAGSQSGKTTYMAGNIGQGAALNTLFYIIDPHRNHPEKSIAAKVAALSDWFILPPAMTHQEIAQVLGHATRVRDLRIQGKPTPYDSYHLMFVVDEIPALMANQRSSDKRIRQLYLELALFMQSLGIQTAKFGMTGLFASQFATKEALGEIDFRDACMSQLIMRLHPTQAQAMRILGPEAVREIPKFPKGHGFLLLADATEVRRVATHNVEALDLEHLARLLPPSPLKAKVTRSGRSQVESGAIIPIRSEVEAPDFDEETSAKPTRNQGRTQFPPAIQAKLDELGLSEDYILHKVDQVTDLLGQNKDDIMRAVWMVSPGGGKEYKQANEEYALVMAIIRHQQEQLRGRQA